MFSINWSQATHKYVNLAIDQSMLTIGIPIQITISEAPNLATRRAGLHLVGQKEEAPLLLLSDRTSGDPLGDHLPR